MRFKQFINEVGPDSTHTLEDVIERIKKECQPFLEQCDGRFMLRGIPNIRVSSDSAERTPQQPAFVSHPVNRKPKDSGRSKYFNFLFNAGVDLAFNISEIRRSTIFATGNTDLAYTFGAINFMFPKGEINFIGSKQIPDSYESSSSFRLQIFLELIDMGYFENLDDIDPSDLPSRVVDGDKIMSYLIKLAGRYPNSHDWLMARSEDEFENDLKVAIKKTFEKYYMKNTELPSLLDHGYEILIYESSGYYLIPAKALIADMKINFPDHDFRQHGEVGLAKEYLTSLLK